MAERKVVESSASVPPTTFLSAMTAARALAVRYNAEPRAASRPFDRERDGNVPGEGAAFLVLESPAEVARRGARVRAQLLGYACQAVGRRKDYDPFAPVADPSPLVRTMRAALHDARRAPAEVSLVSANGSSSVFYDALEAEAIRELLGDVPVHSIKSLLGQTGAVTPALQAVAAALSLERGMIPPTGNASDLDPRCPIALVKTPRAQQLENVLLNAIGFGGFYYASLVLGRAS
jgi:3-oxoacyl-(acyl-carrier-protein) synthase